MDSLEDIVSQLETPDPGTDVLQVFVADRYWNMTQAQLGNDFLLGHCADGQIIVRLEQVDHLIGSKPLPFPIDLETLISSLVLPTRIRFLGIESGGWLINAGDNFLELIIHGRRILKPIPALSGLILEAVDNSIPRN